MLRQVSAGENAIDGRAAKGSIWTDMRFCVCFARVRLELTKLSTRGGSTQATGDGWHVRHDDDVSVCAVGPRMGGLKPRGVGRLERRI